MGYTSWPHTLSYRSRLFPQVERSRKALHTFSKTNSKIQPDRSHRIPMNFSTHDKARVYAITHMHAGQVRLGRQCHNIPALISLLRRMSGWFNTFCLWTSTVKKRIAKICTLKFFFLENLYSSPDPTVWSVFLRQLNARGPIPIIGVRLIRIKIKDYSVDTRR